MLRGRKSKDIYKNWAQKKASCVLYKKKILTESFQYQINELLNIKVAKLN